MEKKLKILLSCYACNPYYGSEPGTGWQFVLNIAKSHIVHVIVEEDENKDDINKYCREHPKETQDITFHYIRRKHKSLLYKIWPPSYYWGYRAWQKKALDLAQHLDKKENFDLVHQITLIGYREPGYLYKLEKPLVWGPIGGFCQTDFRLLKGMGLHSMLYFGMRNVINFFQKRFSRNVRIYAKKAHTILVSDPRAIEEIKKLWNRNSIEMREVGTMDNLSFAREPNSRKTGELLRICWAGTLIPLKALDLLLEALSLCKSSVRLEILGKGKKLNSWKRLSSSLNAKHQIIFHGQLPHDQVTHIMNECHVFCITSIKEGGTPTVVMEALQNGLPVVSLDHCGHASVINDTCGFCIAINTRDKIIKDLASIIDYLAENEEVRQSLSKGSIQRSKEYTWSYKMKVLNMIYANTISMCIKKGTPS